MLTVNVPSSTYDLTVLKTVKAELKIKTGDYDALLKQWIHEASEFCAEYCNRVFAKETVTETLRCVERKVVCLLRYPVISVASVTENGILLDTALYEVEAKSGRLWRKSGSSRIRWCAEELIVNYIGGFDLLATLPRPLERAALDLIKTAYFSSQRDPGVRSVEIPGVISKTYWVGDQSATGSIPPSVVTNLELFKRYDAFGDD